MARRSRRTSQCRRSKSRAENGLAWKRFAGQVGNSLSELKSVRLAILTSHPIQYQAPLFREISGRHDVHVFFGHDAPPQEQANAGFGAAFAWDVDLRSGYANSFLANVSRKPDASAFFGCDTPEIADRLREGRYDALMVTGWGLKSYLQGIVAAKRLRIPIIVRGDSHMLTPRSKIKTTAKDLLYRPFLRLFDAALFVGQMSRAYFEHYGYPRERLHFSPHCVDADWFAQRATAEARAQLRQRLSIDPDARVLLLAGKLISLKRPLDVIRAAAVSRANGKMVEVMVAGDGELKSRFVDEAAQAGVPAHMLGFRNQAEMPSVYAAADCLTLPSAHETWGLVANEALACGRPIVVSDQCGCAPDLAADGIAGRIFKMGDAADFSNAIAGLRFDRAQKEAIARRSRQYSVARAAEGLDAALSACARLFSGQNRSAARR
jgi:glycosyltransferase involved in cell wall biosynthesis